MKKYDLSLFDKAAKYSVSYLDCENIVTPKFLWDFRNNNSLTQVRLANILNVSKKTIEKWEQGKNPIKGSSAVLIYLLDKNPSLMESLVNETFEESKIQVKEFKEEEVLIQNLTFSYESENLKRTNIVRRIGNVRATASV